MSGYLKEVNIKEDLPTVQEALARMNETIRNGKQLGCGAIKLIHGYGSTGRGGKIRVAVRQRLAEMKQKRQIRDYIPGEFFSIFEEPTRQAFLRCEGLRRDQDLERHNNGITIIVF
ncbi:MAG: hypothetical protein ACOX7K_08160 [Oscillospiraceae bacterium]